MYKIEYRDDSRYSDFGLPTILEQLLQTAAATLAAYRSLLEAA